MVWRTDISDAARRDQRTIFRHLADAYQTVSGMALGEALERAGRRVVAIEDAAERLARAPHSGTRHDHLLPGLRHVTRDGTVFWFTLDEDAQVVRILGIFGTGQDHHGRMMRRLGADT